MPSPSSGFFNLLRFNDGEGIYDTDFNDLSQRLNARNLGLDFWAGRALGRARRPADFRHGFNFGTSLHSDGTQGGALQQATTYVPFPYDGILRPQNAATAVDLGALFVENGVLAYAVNGSQQGTRPDHSGQIASIVLGDEDHDLGGDIISNAAPGAGGPRWDTLGVRVNYETTANQPRDFKDAVTGALTSQAFDKLEKLYTDYQYLVGPQDPDYQPGALDPGFAPLVTIRRPQGEGPSPLDPDNFYYHAYPMRLGIEDIPGYEMQPRNSGLWGPDVVHHGSIAKLVNGPGTILAIPRRLHAGCRVIGVGVIGSGWNCDARIEVGRFQYAAGGGTPSFVPQVDLSASTGVGPISGSQSGWLSAGEVDWSGGAQYPLPLWGNGTTRGPLFETHAQSYTITPSPFDKLAVRISEEQAGVAEWVGGDQIFLIRIFYLY